MTATQIERIDLTLRGKIWHHQWIRVSKKNFGRKSIRGSSQIITASVDPSWLQGWAIFSVLLLYKEKRPEGLVSIIEDHP